MADVAYPGRSTYHDEDTTYLGAILKRTSWGAILAGCVAAIGTQMLLTNLGIAIGVTTRDVVADPDERVRTGMTIAAAAWWLATGTLSLLLGGFVVGRFTGMVRSRDVLLHGFTMWATTALFGFIVVASGAGALYGTGMSNTYAGTQAYAYSNGNGEITAVDRAEQPGAAGATGDHLTPAEEERITEYVRTASWWSLFGLMLGIGASLLGSWMGAPERIVVKPVNAGRPEPHFDSSAT